MDRKATRQGWNWGKIAETAVDVQWEQTKRKCDAMGKGNGMNEYAKENIEKLDLSTTLL